MNVFETQLVNGESETSKTHSVKKDYMYGFFGRIFTESEEIKFIENNYFCDFDVKHRKIDFEFFLNDIIADTTFVINLRKKTDDLQRFREQYKNKKFMTSKALEELDQLYNINQFKTYIHQKRGSNI